MLENGSIQLKNSSDNRQITIEERDMKIARLEQHNTRVELLNKMLIVALEEKVSSLNLLDRISMKDKFDIYMINGALLINDDCSEKNKI